ncbi:MAG: PhzF family phenazine biosynthesis protein [Rhodocyclaceae bacterium]|nr:PhzF family phenazine biosynthesis protein [Rhodocyclaceae bacterium]
MQQYQVDAFATKVFAGNPAAVCPLDEWLDDQTLQAIAGENNLSETAFFVPTPHGYHLRWFTPEAEVDLCGHATLASAHVIFTLLGYDKDQIIFQTRSGDLFVKSNNGLLVMDFPAIPSFVCDAPSALVEGLGHQPLEVLATKDDYIAVFPSEEVVRSLSPDFAKLKELPLRAIAVTAAGTTVDFVSRFFAPRLGVNEDPVTGSAHCALAPYWSGKLKKNVLLAKQVSKRGGDLKCELQGDRILISGYAVTFMVAEIDLG